MTGAVVESHDGKVVRHTGLWASGTVIGRHFSALVWIRRTEVVSLVPARSLPLGRYDGWNRLVDRFSVSHETQALVSGRVWCGRCIGSASTVLAVSFHRCVRIRSSRFSWPANDLSIFYSGRVGSSAVQLLQPPIGRLHHPSSGSDRRADCGLIGPRPLDRTNPHWEARETTNEKCP